MIREFLRTFRKPSARTLAHIEFEDAQRSLLAAHSAVEYAQSLVTYHQARVSRLEAYLKESACNPM